MEDVRRTWLGSKVSLDKRVSTRLRNTNDKGNRPIRREVGDGILKDRLKVGSKSESFYKIFLL